MDISSKEIIQRCHLFLRNLPKRLFRVQENARSSLPRRSKQRVNHHKSQRRHQNRSHDMYQHGSERPQIIPRLQQCKDLQ